MWADASSAPGPSGPAFPASEQADQGVGRGPEDPIRTNLKAQFRSDSVVIQGQRFADDIAGHF